MSISLKEKIENLYHKKLNYDQISKELNCSKSTISYHLRDIRLKEKIERFEWLKSIEKETFKNKVEFIEAYGKLLSTRELIKISRKLFHKQSSQFKSNSPEYYRNRRKEIKESLINYKGGKCEKCGYDKCIKALQFHHIDPNKKDFTISKNIKSLKFEDVKKEVDKCILVCANCHAEIHDNVQLSLGG